jgi:type VI secretion system secreted protein Hcp
MAAFIKFDGVVGLKGEATDKDHQGWSELSSYSWGDTQATYEGPRGGTGRQGQASVKEVRCFREGGDNLSVGLFEFAARGNLIPKVLIDNTRIYGDKAQTTFLQVELNDVIISSYQTSAGGDAPTESFSLDFTKIAFRYTTYHD